MAITSFLKKVGVLTDDHPEGSAPTLTPAPQSRQPSATSPVTRSFEVTSPTSDVAGVPEFMTTFVNAVNNNGLAGLRMEISEHLRGVDELAPLNALLASYEKFSKISDPKARLSAAVINADPTPAALQAAQKLLDDLLLSVDKVLVLPDEAQAIEAVPVFVSAAEKAAELVDKAEDQLRQAQDNLAQAKTLKQQAEDTLHGVRQNADAIFQAYTAARKDVSASTNDLINRAMVELAKGAA